MTSSNVYLVGPMGVGKTTVGRFVADELSFPFFDIDREIEDRAGADIPWIFDVEGEEGFRQREHRTLKDLSSQQGAVFATGGGIVLKPENRSILAKQGVVVYLTAPLDLLVERTGRDKRRPLLLVDNPRAVLARTLEIRDPLYREVASFVVTSDYQNPRQLAKEIAGQCRRMLDSSFSV